MFYRDLIFNDTAVFTFERITGPIAGGARRLVVSSCSLPVCGVRCLWLDENLTQATLFTRLEASFARFEGVPRQLALRPIRPFGRPLGRRVALVAAIPSLLPTPWLSAGGHSLQPSPGHGSGGAHRGRVAAPALAHCRGGAERAEPCSREGSRAPGRIITSALPAYVRSQETFRKVGSDGFVTYAGDSYSVPPFYAGQSVWVRRRHNRIDICLQNGSQIASHLPGDGRGLVRLEQQHFEVARRRAQHDLHALRCRFLATFIHHQDFLDQLIAQRRLGAAATLRALFVLARTTDHAELESAIQACLRYNNFSHRFLQGFLEQQPAAAAIVNDDDPIWTEGLLF